METFAIVRRAIEGHEVTCVVIVIAICLTLCWAMIGDMLHPLTCVCQDCMSTFYEKDVELMWNREKQRWEWKCSNCGKVHPLVKQPLFEANRGKDDVW